MNKIQPRKAVTINLHIAEKALRGFNSEFPRVMSNVKYNHIIDSHKDDLRYKKFIKMLKAKSVLAGFMIDNMRKMYETSTNKLDFLTRTIKNTGTAGCRECSFITHSELKKMGIPSQNIRFSITTKDGINTTKNHAFTVMGLDEKADLTEPKTWGKNAVILDGWANFAKRANEGINYYKDMFKYNPEKEICKFEYHRNF